MPVMGEVCVMTFRILYETEKTNINNTLLRNLLIYNVLGI